MNESSLCVTDLLSEYITRCESFLCRFPHCSSARPYRGLSGVTRDVTVLGSRHDRDCGSALFGTITHPITRRVTLTLLSKYMPSNPATLIRPLTQPTTRHVTLLSKGTITDSLHHSPCNLAFKMYAVKPRDLDTITHTSYNSAHNLAFKLHAFKPHDLDTR